MKIHQVRFQQKFPVSIEKLWDFFSSPHNLAELTPEDMAFVVTSSQQPKSKMYPGMIITYKVSPIAGIKLNWMTEITEVSEHQYFIDEQRFGPFKFWHHQHHFKAIDGGVEMTDHLTYGLPFGIIGELAHGILVKKKLQDIFEYRRKKGVELFGEL